MAAGLGDYYDVVLLGKTGQGRTTLGSKLLDVKGTDGSRIRLFQSAGEDGEVYLSDAEGKSCELMSNEKTRVRVLDVPGFSDSHAKQQATIQANMLIIKWIGTVLSELQLNVRRMVYFLPVRGPLEKADGAMQEELKMLNHYFRRDIFNCMVIVATNPPKERFQQAGFDNSELEETKEAFQLALNTTVEEDIECPPIVYVSLNDGPKECLSKIQNALVLKESIKPLRIKEDAGPLYTVKVDESVNAEVGMNVESRCTHPSLNEKYSGAQKIVGGIAYVVLLGIPLAISYITGIGLWPGFTNSDKVCAECHESLEVDGFVLISHEEGDGST